MKSVGAFSKPSELPAIQEPVPPSQGAHAHFLTREPETEPAPKPAATGVPLFWQVLMVLAAGLYLIPEAIFNAELVNVSGQGVIDNDSLRHIELFGRLISGIGVSLLVCDAIGSRFVRNGASALSVAVIVFLLCWPTVFFGQKILVDQLIIEPSSAEDRQHAYLSQLVRSALANNTIQVEGIDYDPDRKFNPQEMTFMALFGGMVYADDRLATVFTDRGRDVIEAMVRKDAYGNFESHWAEYSKLYDTLEAQYTDYATASRQYNAALAEIPAKQDSYWNDVNAEIDRGWTEYRKAVDAHRRQARASAEEYGPKIFDYFKRRNQCRSESCVSRLDKRYYQGIEKLGLGKIDPPYWHKQVPVSVTENVSKTIGTAIGTLGLSLIAQGADLISGGDGGFEDSKTVFTNDIDHYEAKIGALPAFDQRFVDKTGYPADIGNFVSFKRHPATSANLIRFLTNKGISMPESWRVTDRNTFDHQVRRKMTNAANAEWAAKTDERGLDIKPNVPWKKFQLLPVVQEKIQAQMGEHYVSPTYADWSKQTFKERVIDRAIDRETQDIIARLEAQEQSFADGEANEVIGKQMLRGIVIPPISMGLSLLLVTLTLIKLPGKLVGLFRKGQPRKRKIHMRVGLSSFKLALVFAVPLLLWSPAYTQEGSTVHYFLAKTAESGGQGTKLFLSWVLHAQPIMHPVGDSLESATLLYERSARPIAALESLDERFIPAGS